MPFVGTLPAVVKPLRYSLLRRMFVCRTHLVWRQVLHFRLSCPRETVFSSVISCNLFLHNFTGGVVAPMSNVFNAF
jgi:hypothetical protein